MEEVKSLGVALTDGLWDLVTGNIACLMRLGTVTRNGHYRDIGCALASGETGWVTYMMNCSFQRLAIQKFHMDPQELYLGLHVIDGGKGLENGLRGFLRIQLLRKRGKTNQTSTM